MMIKKINNRVNGYKPLSLQTAVLKILNSILNKINDIVIIDNRIAIVAEFCL